MSWGELSCKHVYDCKHNPTMIQCNKDCKHYQVKPEESFHPSNVFWDGYKIYARKGLLWMGKHDIDVITADAIAKKYGFTCAERLVKAMSGS